MVNTLMRNITLIALSFALVMSGCASQQDVATLDYRLSLIEQRYVESEKRNKELKSRLETYKKAKKQNDQELRSRTASQHATLDQIRDEVAALRGRIEEAEYLINQKIKAIEGSGEKEGNRLARIDQTVSLNKDRIERLEQYLDFEATESNFKMDVHSGKKSDVKAEKQLSENEIYNSAKKSFDQGDFETASLGFQKLLKRYPKSRHADNAQFWIGEIYYREKLYEKAILEYQKVIENYPKGNKVQSSLLKQGLAFSNIGDKANARLILKELVKKYPKSNEAKIAKRKLKGLSP